MNTTAMETMHLMPTLRLLIFPLLICSCSLPNTEPEFKATDPQRTAKPQEPIDGTGKMVKLLQTINASSSGRNNAFRNEDRISMFSEILQKAQPSEQFKYRFLRAEEMLNAGHTSEAIAEFEILLDTLNSPTARIGENLSRKLKLLSAVAYMRLGEQDNCIRNATPQSCILPFEAGALHRTKFPAQSSVERFTSYLQEYPDDLTARWLLNISYMALGKHPHGVPDTWRMGSEVFESDYPLARFHEKGSDLNIDVVGLSGGVVIEDFDQDGHLDIMVSSWGIGDQLRLFMNNADGSFTERTTEAGLSGMTGGLNMNHADYNNDGHPDVLILRGGWLENGEHPNSLLHNNGDGTFKDVTEWAGLLSMHPTQTAAWGDFNNDGWLDLFIGNETWQGKTHSSELFMSDRDGTFTDVAPEMNLTLDAFVKGCGWGDLDNDGYMDLYVSNMAGQNFLFRNNGADSDGNWSFTDIAEQAGVIRPTEGFAIWFFDYDNDGWQDIFATAYSLQQIDHFAQEAAAEYLGLPFRAEPPCLYRNNGNGTFTDVTETVGLMKPLFAMGCNYGDLDNDGFLDFYLGTGEPNMQAVIPNRMFRNDAGKRFQDVTTSGGFGHLHRGHAISFADIDNDGDQDIYAVMGGAYEGSIFPNLLFENPGTENNRITLQLEGVRSNRSAIGVRIRISVQKDGEMVDIYRTVSTGGSFGSNPLRQEIGLGAAEAISKIEIRWPASETVQVFEDVPINRSYRIVEDASRLQRVNTKEHVLDKMHVRNFPQ